MMLYFLTRLITIKNDEYSQESHYSTLLSISCWRWGGNGDFFYFLFCTQVPLSGSTADRAVIVA